MFTKLILRLLLSTFTSLTFDFYVFYFFMSFTFDFYVLYFLFYFCVCFFLLLRLLITVFYFYNEIDRFRLVLTILLYCRNFKGIFFTIIVKYSVETPLKNLTKFYQHRKFISLRRSIFLRRN